jgi:gas vesicle protein
MGDISMDGQGQLNRNDLMLMMDGYKNNVEMYTVIMEQLKQINEQLNTVLTNQKDIVTKQRVTCDTLGKISESLATTFQTHREWIKETLEDFKEDNKESLRSVMEEFKEGHGGIYKKVDGMDKDMQASIKEYIRDQGALKIRFNRIYGVMGGIVIAAIGAVATAYTKMIDLHTIVDLLTKIVNHMGIVIK